MLIAATAIAVRGLTASPLSATRIARFDLIIAERPHIHHTEVELPRHVEAGKLARAFLGDRFAHVLSADAVRDAFLVASELVTNAVAHGEGRIVLRASLQADTLRLEVIDDGTGEAPAIREQTEDGKGGWGLRIVEGLSLRWGAFEGTTHVWAELPAR